MRKFLDYPSGDYSKIHEFPESWSDRTDPERPYNKGNKVLTKLKIHNDIIKPHFKIHYTLYNKPNPTSIYTKKNFLLYIRFFLLFLVISHNAMAALTCTFKDRITPYCGISIHTSS